jgi:hypothetical protein
MRQEHTMRSLPLQSRSSRDRGAALPLVLVITVVLATLVVVITTYAPTNLVYGRVTSDRADRLTAADAGLQFAVDRLRNDGCSSDGNEIRWRLPTGTNDFNGTTADITCDDETGRGVSGQEWAAVLTGQGLGEGDFLIQTQGGNARKKITGSVWMSRVNQKAFDLKTDLEITNRLTYPKLLGECPPVGVTEPSPLKVGSTDPLLRCPTPRWETAPPSPKVSVTPNQGRHDDSIHPGCRVFFPGFYDTPPALAPVFLYARKYLAGNITAKDLNDKDTTFATYTFARDGANVVDGFARWALDDASLETSQLGGKQAVNFFVEGDLNNLKELKTIVVTLYVNGLDGPVVAEVIEGTQSQVGARINWSGAFDWKQWDPKTAQIEVRMQVSKANTDLRLHRIEWSSLRDVYFGSGEYLFDFPQGSTTFQIDVRGARVTAGKEPSRGQPDKSSKFLSPACEKAMDDDKGSGQGATFYMAGQSHLAINDQGSFEIHPRQQDGSFVSIQALCNPSLGWCTDSLSAGGSAVVNTANLSNLNALTSTLGATAGASNTPPSIVYTKPGDNSQMIIHGLVYAPLAKMEFGNVSASAVHKALGGLVLSRILLQSSNSAEFFEISSLESEVVSRIVLESTATKNGRATSMRAVVEYPSKKIVSWRVCETSPCSPPST